MQIILAKSLGFCSGVKRAVDTAMKVCGKDVFVLGELIHNERVTAMLKEKGSTVVNSAGDVPDGAKVIIRWHGEAKSTFEQLKGKSADVIDCTCPFVRRTQKIVEEYHNKGYKIVIAGERNHPEVKGLDGWCGNTALITDGSDDLAAFAGENVCIVAQTTFSAEKFDLFLQKIKKNALKTVEIFNTICYTTRERQEEANRLSEICDCMIVIGSTSSSNTRKLYDVCREKCASVFLIESADLVDIKNIKSFNKLGVVSGASTPREQTMEVFFSMEEKNTAAEVIVNEANEATTETVAEPKVMNEMEEAVAKMDDKATKLEKDRKLLLLFRLLPMKVLLFISATRRKKSFFPKKK